MFCVKCGKDIEQGVFCSECNPIQLEVKEVVLSKCECKRYQIDGAWRELSEKEAVAAILKKNKQKPVLEELYEERKKLFAKVGFQDEHFSVPIQKKGITCTSCSKKGQYYEGVLQLRDCEESVLEYAVKLVDEKQGVFINKMEIVTNGWDLYCSSSLYLRTLTKQLREKFGGIVKSSKKLFSRNHLTSKDVYRTAFLFRPHPFKVGDEVDVKGKKVVVVSLGKKPQGKEVGTGKKMFIPVRK